MGLKDFFEDGIMYNTEEVCTLYRGPSGNFICTFGGTTSRFTPEQAKEFADVIYASLSASGELGGAGYTGEATVAPEGLVGASRGYLDSGLLTFRGDRTDDGEYKLLLVNKENNEVITSFNDVDALFFVDCLIKATRGILSQLENDSHE